MFEVLQQGSVVGRDPEEEYSEIKARQQSPPSEHAAHALSLRSAPEGGTALIPILQMSRESGVTWADWAAGECGARSSGGTESATLPCAQTQTRASWKLGPLPPEGMLRERRWCRSLQHSVQVAGMLHLQTGGATPLLGLPPSEQTQHQLLALRESLGESCNLPTQTGVGTPGDTYPAQQDPPRSLATHWVHKRVAYAL